VETLDLARSGRAARLGQQMLDALLAADRIEEHLHRRMVETAGEHFAVVGQDLHRNPISADRGPQPVTDRPGPLTGHHPRRHAIPRVVIDTGQHFR
jgi:hypothetical protein